MLTAIRKLLTQLIWYYISLFVVAQFIAPLTFTVKFAVFVVAQFIAPLTFTVRVNLGHLYTRRIECSGTLHLELF